ncbi:MAG: GC-type dockerin domain-anchored protein [Planctomycetota bacterium]|nr:GC-type dockerin domain-anchored protein [Planctomycetota bacterium]
MSDHQRSWMSVCVFAAAGAAVWAGSPTAMAQLDPGDIVPYVENGRIETGRASSGGGLERNVRVFPGVFGESPNFTNDPGFDTGPNGFPAGVVLGFDILRALRVWDGSSFTTIPAERISVRFGPLGPVRTPTTDVRTPGFGLAVSSTGEYHHHFGYTLQAPAAAGIYLYEFELWTNSPSIGPSKPTWIVFNQNRPVAEQEAAIEWVRRNFLCAADFNSDGQADFFDYLDFAQAFGVDDPSADFNGDGQVDFFDYLDFAQAFEQGCP